MPATRSWLNSTLPSSDRDFGACTAWQAAEVAAQNMVEWLWGGPFGHWWPPRLVIRAQKNPLSSPRRRYDGVYCTRYARSASRLSRHSIRDRSPELYNTPVFFRFISYFSFFLILLIAHGVTLYSICIATENGTQGQGAHLVSNSTEAFIHVL